MIPTPKELQDAISALTPHATLKKERTWRCWPLWLGGRVRWLGYSAAGIRKVEDELFQNFNEVRDSMGEIDKELRTPLFLWIALVASEPELTIADVISDWNRLSERGWLWLWAVQLKPLPKVLKWLLAPLCGLPKGK